MSILHRFFRVFLRGVSILNNKVIVHVKGTLWSCDRGSPHLRLRRGLHLLRGLLQGLQQVENIFLNIKVKIMVSELMPCDQ